MNIKIQYYKDNIMKDNLINLSHPVVMAPEDENKVYKDLIEQVKTNRLNTLEMLERIKKYTTQVDSMIPNSTDFKSRFVVESKIKAVTEIMNVQLNIQKAIDQSVKDEFELRRKSDALDSGETKGLDIRDLVSALEIMENKDE